jgi:hypothetical protein
MNEIDELEPRGGRRARSGRAIRELPASERPRERLAMRGAGGLAAAELIGLLWGSGARGRSAVDLATDALARHEGLTGLARATELELEALPGVGAAKAAQLTAAFELGRRLMADWPAGRWTIRSPRDVADRLLLQMGRLEREELRVVLPCSGRGAVPGRGPPQRERRDPRPQPPVRRPDPVTGRPAPDGRSPRGGPPARYRPARPPGGRS